MVARLDAVSTFLLFETVMHVAPTLPLELNSAFEDFPFFIMLDFVAFSSLILAAFSFCESLSDASSSSTMSRAFFWWRVSWDFLYAWVVWAVFLASRVNMSLQWFLRIPVSSAALISVATFLSTSRALEKFNHYHGIMTQSVKELTWECFEKWKLDTRVDIGPMMLRLPYICCWWSDIPILGIHFQETLDEQWEDAAVVSFVVPPGWEEIRLIFVIIRTRAVHEPWTLGLLRLLTHAKNSLTSSFVSRYIKLIRWSYSSSVT